MHSLPSYLDQSFELQSQAALPWRKEQSVPIVRRMVDRGAGMETVGKRRTVSGTTHRLSDTSFRLMWGGFQITAKLRTSLKIICVNS